MLIQFPPGLDNEHTDQLDKLLSCIREINPAQDWKIAKEFRNKSWYHEHVYDAFKNLKPLNVLLQTKNVTGMTS